MTFTLVTVAIGLVLLTVIIELLRRRQLREKYAILWLCVGFILMPLALSPAIFDAIATMVGIASGLSLAFLLAIAFLLLVCVHLSWEVSRLEEETRVLAEEVALIRAQLAELNAYDHDSPAAGLKIPQQVNVISTVYAHGSEVRP